MSGGGCHGVGVGASSKRPREASPPGLPEASAKQGRVLRAEVGAGGAQAEAGEAAGEDMDEEADAAIIAFAEVETANAGRRQSDLALDLRQLEQEKEDDVLQLAAVTTAAVEDALVDSGMPRDVAEDVASRHYALTAELSREQLIKSSWRNRGARAVAPIVSAVVKAAQQRTPTDAPNGASPAATPVAREAAGASAAAASAPGDATALEVCPCCSDALTPETRFVVANCEHAMCVDCARGWVQTRVQDILAGTQVETGFGGGELDELSNVNNTAVTCPLGCSSGSFPESRLKELLPEKLFAHLMRRRREVPTPNVVHCATPTCSGYVRMPPSMRAMADASVRCSICHMETCARCGMPSHAPASCACRSLSERVLQAVEVARRTQDETVARVTRQHTEAVQRVVRMTTHRRSAVLMRECMMGAHGAAAREAAMAFAAAANMELDEAMRQLPQNDDDDDDLPPYAGAGGEDRDRDRDRGRFERMLGDRGRELMRGDYERAARRVVRDPMNPRERREPGFLEVLGREPRQPQNAPPFRPPAAARAAGAPGAGHNRDEREQEEEGNAGAGARIAPRQRGGVQDRQPVQNRARHPHRGNNPRAGERMGEEVARIFARMLVQAATPANAIDVLTELIAAWDRAAAAAAAHPSARSLDLGPDWDAVFTMSPNEVQAVLREIESTVAEQVAGPTDASASVPTRSVAIGQWRLNFEVTAAQLAQIAQANNGEVGIEPAPAEARGVEGAAAEEAANGEGDESDPSQEAALATNSPTTPGTTPGTTLNYIGAACLDCPKCFRPIEKRGGCAHMKCVCGYSFCWRCMGEFKSYAHQCPDGKSSFQMMGLRGGANPRHLEPNDGAAPNDGAGAGAGAEPPRPVMGTSEAAKAYFLERLKPANLEADYRAYVEQAQGTDGLPTKETWIAERKQRLQQSIDNYDASNDRNDAGMLGQGPMHALQMRIHALRAFQNAATNLNHSNLNLPRGCADFEREVRPVASWRPAAPRDQDAAYFGRAPMHTLRRLTRIAELACQCWSAAPSESAGVAPEVPAGLLQSSRAPAATLQNGEREATWHEIREAAVALRDSLAASPAGPCKLVAPPLPPMQMEQTGPGGREASIACAALLEHELVLRRENELLSTVDARTARPFAAASAAVDQEASAFVDSHAPVAQCATLLQRAIASLAEPAEDARGPTSGVENAAVKAAEWLLSGRRTVHFTRARALLEEGGALSPLEEHQFSQLEMHVQDATRIVEQALQAAADEETPERLFGVAQLLESWTATVRAGRA